MDTEHFDDLIRSLCSGASRRGVLAGLASGLLTALPLALGGTEAAARKQSKKKGKRKKRKQRGNSSNPPPPPSPPSSPSPPPLPPPQPPPPPPPTPPPPVCPPFCPVCQRCNGETGQCAALPSLNGQSGPGCAPPRVCCGGTCCDPINQCNAAGACAACAEVCPNTCDLCLTLADGGTMCGDIANSACIAEPTCTTSADCPATHPYCVTSMTRRASNLTTQPCGTVGSGFCYRIGGCT